VRDGLSLLDQAIALAEGEVTEGQVREMLGLADRTQLFDLFDRLMAGDAAGALRLTAEMYNSGADPVVLLQDLLELAHWLTRIKIVPQAAEGPAVPETERVRGRKMAEALSMGVLARTWQMLRKGLGEAQIAPSPLQAVEMVLIRLTHAAELPTPAELVQQLQGTDSRPAAGAPAQPSPAQPSPAQPSPAQPSPAQPSPAQPSPARAAPAMGPTIGGAPGGSRETGRGQPIGQSSMQPNDRPRAALAVGGAVAVPPVIDSPVIDPPAIDPQVIDPSAIDSEQAEAALPDPRSFPEVVALCAAKREGLLQGHLLNSVHLVRFEPGRIELRPTGQAPANLANRLGAGLSGWTGRRWVVSVSGEKGEPTLAEQAAAAEECGRQAVLAHPLVEAVMQHFPGATVETIRDLIPAATTLDWGAEGDPDAGEDGPESSNGDESP
jgi:DNA polymerase-3 subunit gamma/tau